MPSFDYFTDAPTSTMSPSTVSTVAEATMMTTTSSNSSYDAAVGAFSNVFLFFLLFGLSATVDLKSLKKQISNKKAIALGASLQFFAMPLLGFLSVLAFRSSGYTRAMATTLLVVTSSPGGAFSNWWCSMFNAELALSVAMTTASTLLSMGFLPANLMLYSYLAFDATTTSAAASPSESPSGSVVDALDFKSLFQSLGLVIGAVVSGLYAGYKWDTPRFHVNANRAGSFCGLGLVALSLMVSSGGNGADATFWNQRWEFYLATALPCLLGMLVANLSSLALKRPHPETVAIAIECCYQNVGIATSVSITMFQDKNERAQAIAVALFYGAVQTTACAAYCVWAWKMGWTKAPPSESICVVVTKTYEVVEGDDKAEGINVEIDNDSSNGEVEVSAMEEGNHVSSSGGADDATQPSFFGRIVNALTGRISENSSSSNSDRRDRSNDDVEKGHINEDDDAATATTISRTDSSDASIATAADLSFDSDGDDDVVDVELS